MKNELKIQNTDITDNSTISKIETVENYFREKQEYWNSRIKELNSLMSTLPDLMKFMNQIYSVRQEAVEYYHNILQVSAGQTENYKKRYAECYNRIKVNSQIRYTTESAINVQIENELSSLKETIDLINNHANYMDNTIRTIDDMIYGIKYRIDINKLINKVEF